jgi:hypothetical protein
MKVGDLIQFKNDRWAKAAYGKAAMGMIVAAPDQGCDGEEPSNRFKVAWFEAGGFDGMKKLYAGQQSCHLEKNLELISSCK